MSHHSSRHPPPAALAVCPLRRRTFASLAVLAAASIAAPCAVAQGKLEKTRVAIAVGGKAACYHLPLTIAEQLGYFRAEGLEVDIADFAGGMRALQAVAAGSADVVSGAFEHTINLQSKSQFYQAFVLQGRAPQIALGISTKTMAGYKSLADLRGKKIGVSAPGSSTNMLVSLLLSRVGIKAILSGFTAGSKLASALSAVLAPSSGNIPSRAMASRTLLNDARYRPRSPRK